MLPFLIIVCAPQMLHQFPFSLRVKEYRSFSLHPKLSPSSFYNILLHAFLVIAVSFHFSQTSQFPGSICYSTTDTEKKDSLDTLVSKGKSRRRMHTFNLNKPSFICRYALKTCDSIISSLCIGLILVCTQKEPLLQQIPT